MRRREREEKEKEREMNWLSLETRLAGNFRGCGGGGCPICPGEDRKILKGPLKCIHREPGCIFQTR